MGKYVSLNVRPDTKDLVMERCKKEFLKDNPKFEGMHLSHEFMVQRIAKYYLEN